MSWLTDKEAWIKSIKTIVVVIGICYCAGFFFTMGSKAAGGLAVFNLTVEQLRVTESPDE